MYNLEPFFDYVISEEIKYDLGLVREIPNLKLKINKYKDVWNKSERKSQKAIMKSFGSSFSRTDSQVFVIPYQLPANCQFDLKIYIPKLKEIVKDIDLMEDDENIINKYLRDKDYIKNFSIKNIVQDDENKGEVNGLKMGIFKDFVKTILDYNIKEIDTNYAKTRLETNDPIICLDFTGLDNNSIPYFIVDGNHQAYAKVYLKNQQIIDTYMLSRNLWIKCLLTESDKTFIKIYNNLNYMLGYMKGMGDLANMNSNMYDLY